MPARLGHAILAILFATVTSVPTSSYHFVDPPPAFTAGNVGPTDYATSIAMGAKGTQPAKFATADGQLEITMAADAIPAGHGATSISVRVTPLAPRHLAAPPDGLRADGNAYQVDMTYEPSGVSVTQLATPGTLQMKIPELAQNLFLSPDARTWTALAAQPVAPANLGLRASFVAPGYYLAATDQPARTTASAKSNTTTIVLVVVAAAVVILLGGYAVTRRRRSETTSTRTGSPTSELRSRRTRRR